MLSAMLLVIPSSIDRQYYVIPSIILKYFSSYVNSLLFSQYCLILIKFSEKQQGCNGISINRAPLSFGSLI